MEKLFENKALKGLQRFGEKLAGNRYLSAISGGLMSTMALIMVGAVFQIVSQIPGLSADIKSMLSVPYNMTMGIMSLVAAFAIAHALATSFKIKALPAAITSAAVFLMVAAPSITTYPEGGMSVNSAMDTGALGGIGLFTAIIIALVSVRITKFCQDKRITIRMPDVVPQFLADSFSALIPLLFNTILFYGLNLILQATIDMTLPNAILALFSVPLSALTSGAGVFIVALFALVLWIFGIHGTMVMIAVFMPSYLQAIEANAALVNAGQAPLFTPVLVMLTIASVGGTGCTLGMTIMGLRSKSEQIKAVSKAAVVPGFFNINEPVVFGYPVVYNPIMAIPYIVGSLLVMALTWIGYAIGFLKPAFIPLMSVMPMGVAEFLGTLSWTNALWPYLMIPVTMAVWFPFYKVYEHQLVKKEQALLEAERAEADKKSGKAATA